MFEIGTSLREARARRKLSYDQVEAETKIRAKYIRCLEDEEFDTLPSGTYVKGFLRTYADYLGLDGQLYVDEYNSRYGDSHAEDMIFRRRERPLPRRRYESSNTVLITLAAIVAITVLFFVAWRYGDSQRVTPPPPAAPQQAAGTKNPQLDPTVAPNENEPQPARKRKKRVPVTTKVVIRAEGGSSWVVLKTRLDGKGVFHGVIGPDSFVGPAKDPAGFIITEAGAPEYLRLTVNDRTYVLTGSPPWRVTKQGVQSIGGSAVAG
jgi:cytoskeletal protein RodZ